MGQVKWRRCQSSTWTQLQNQKQVPTHVRSQCSWPFNKTWMTLKESTMRICMWRNLQIQSFFRMIWMMFHVRRDRLPMHMCQQVSLTGLFIACWRMKAWPLCLSLKGKVSLCDATNSHSSGMQFGKPRKEILPQHGETSDRSWCLS